MAPRQWKRPLTLIYDNNYKYGTNLYSGAIDDIERKYLSSMSRTRLPVDRPDVSLTTFAGSSLATGQRETTTASSTTAIQETSSYDLRKVKSVSDFDLYRSLHDWTPTLATIPSRSSYLESTTAAAQEAEERRSRRRRRRRADDLDRLELHSIAQSPSYSTYSYGERASEKMDVSFWMDKCRHFQTELDSLMHRVTETESQIKADSASAKNKIQAGIAELAHELEDTTRQSGELQKVIKRQAKHLAELQSLYDEVQRHLADASEELGGNERRCHHLQNELDSIKYSIEQASRTRGHAW